MPENSFSELFNSAYKGYFKSPTYHKNVKKVYGNEYPDVGHFGYTTKSELLKISNRFETHSHLIDLACGTGGPGLWIANHSQCNLVGIDISLDAIKAAQGHSSPQHSFILGDISNTPFPNQSFDGAICIDAFIFAPDKLKALKEVNRIIKKESFLVFTNWDRETSPPFYPPPTRNHRPILEEAGFEIVTYEIDMEAEDKRRELYHLNIKSADAFFKEMGEESANIILDEARLSTGEFDGIDHTKNSKRIFVEAFKK